MSINALRPNQIRYLQPHHPIEAAKPPRVELAQETQATTKSVYIPDSTPRDYEAIFRWAERVTGKPIAYTTPEAKWAYIESLKGRPQSYYDTTGFLHSIGVYNVESYGREPRNMTCLLDYVQDHRPKDKFKRMFVWLQRLFMVLWKRCPAAIFRLCDSVDRLFLHRDRIDQSWLKTPIPQPPLDEGTAVSIDTIRKRYADTDMAKHLSTGAPLVSVPTSRTFVPQPLFNSDFHLGAPKEGQPSPQYGTYALARAIGFTDEQARRIGEANTAVDHNKTPYGKTGAFPGYTPSRHFNLNHKKPKAGDTRMIWARRHLDAAVALVQRGRFDQAEQELGYGLHSLQDAFAHAHLGSSIHLILGETPDLVSYNPVPLAEASQATIAYLNSYLRRALSYPGK